MPGLFSIFSTESIVGDEHHIVIECSDGEVVAVDKDIILANSNVIRRKYETLGDNPNVVVTMDNVTKFALERAMEYCIIHTKKVQNGKKIQDLNAWDEKFVRLERKEKKKETMRKRTRMRCEEVERES